MTKRWARIENGAVREIVELLQDLTPGVHIFHPSLTFVECADTAVVPGWL